MEGSQTMAKMKNEKTGVKYAVTYLDYGDGTDGRPRCYRICDTKEEADFYVKDDMLVYSEAMDAKFIDWDSYEVWADEQSKWEEGCVWNISEVAA